MSIFGSLGNVGMLHEGEAAFVYYLEREAAGIDLAISDAQGDVVWRGGGTKLAGRNVLLWDGRNNRGQDMPDGAYKITVRAVDEFGDKILSKTYTTGRITSVDSKNGAMCLSFGGMIVPLDQVLSIREPINMN